MENLNLSVQINQGDGNLNYQGKMDPAVEAALARLKDSWDKAKEKKKRVNTGAARALVDSRQVQPVHLSRGTVQPVHLTRSFYIKAVEAFSQGKTRLRRKAKTENYAMKRRCQ